jgi:hypothetical protein
MSTKKTLLKVIRQQCIDCMGGQLAEIPLCTSPKCSLFAFRMGKDPCPSKTIGDTTRQRFSTKK